MKQEDAADISRHIVPFRKSYEDPKPTSTPWLYAEGFLIIPALRNGDRLTPKEHLLFVYLLKAAAFRDHVRDFHGHPVAIGVGETIVTVRNLAADCHWPKTDIQRMLDKLQDLGLIARKKGRIGSIRYARIEIVDYSCVIKGSNYIV